MLSYTEILFKICNLSINRTLSGKGLQSGFEICASPVVLNELMAGCIDQFRQLSYVHARGDRVYITIGLLAPRDI